MYFVKIKKKRKKNIVIIEKLQTLWSTFCFGIGECSGFLGLRASRRWWWVKPTAAKHMPNFSSTWNCPMPLRLKRCVQALKRSSKTWWTNWSRLKHSNKKPSRRVFRRWQASKIWTRTSPDLTASWKRSPHTRPICATSNSRSRARLHSCLAKTRLRILSHDPTNFRYEFWFVQKRQQKNFFFSAHHAHLYTIQIRLQQVTRYETHRPFF